MEMHCLSGDKDFYFDINDVDLVTVADPPLYCASPGKKVMEIMLRGGHVITCSCPADVVDSFIQSLKNRGNGDSTNRPH